MCPLKRGVLQYCAKVMQTNFNDFCALFSENFDEMSPKFRKDSNHIKTKFNKILLMTTKFRNHENLRMQNVVNFRTSENSKKQHFTDFHSCNLNFEPFKLKQTTNQSGN